MNKITLLTLALALLPGCAMPPGFFVSGDATMMQPIAVDGKQWRFWAGGKDRDNIGQVTIKAGYALTPHTDIYTGISHLSLLDYGEDDGYNSLIVGLQTRKQW